MRRLILTILTYFSLSGAIYASTTASTDSIPNRYVVDEVVAVVGNNIVLLSDLNETVKTLNDQYKSRGMTPKNSVEAEALETLLIQKFLAAQAAIDSLPIPEGQITSMAEAKVQELIDKYGSVKEVERVYGRPIFTIRDVILRRKVTEQVLAQSMQQEAQKDITITPMEVRRYIDSTDPDSIPEVPDQYIIAQIVKLPKLNDDSRMDLKERLIGFRKRILDGDAKFATLASMYSDDPMSALKGGEMPPQPKEAFVGPFAGALEKLKPGQISDVVETEFGFHIIELIDKSGNNYHCRHILLQLKFDQEQLNIAQAQLDSIAGVIKSGSMTFEEAALEFSDDENTKKDGGIVVNNLYEAYGGPKLKTTKFFREELESKYDRIKNLEVGEISDSFTELDREKRIEVARIIKLISIVPAHRASLKEDYDKLEEMVKTMKQVSVFEDWIEKKIAEMYIRIEAPYNKLPIKNSVWFK